MKRTRFTDEQIIGILAEHEAGAKCADLCRKHGMSEGTFYNWKTKFGGLTVSEAKRLKALEDKSAKPKKLLAEQMLDLAAMKDLVSINVWSAPLLHYVYEPEFCNPAAGWEKGQVEKNVRDSRHQMLLGMPDFSDLAALNVWLEQHCLELWRQTAHGRLAGTIADVWAEEQAALMPLPVAFDGFVELSKRVSPTCLIGDVAPSA